MLVYVNDVIHLAKYAQEDIQVYQLKEGFATSDRYLGANVDKVQLRDGRIVWSMTCI